MIKSVLFKTLFVCVALFAMVSCSSDSTAGTQVGNEFTLNGVAATGYALVNSEVRFESNKKVLASAITDSLGRFEIEINESTLELNQVYYLRSDSSVGAPFFLELGAQGDTFFVLMHPVGDYIAGLADSQPEFKSKADFKAWQDSVLSKLLGPGVKSEEVFHNRQFVAAKLQSNEKFSPWDLIIHTVTDSARRAKVPPHVLMDELSKKTSYLLSDSAWRELLANQAGYLGMSEEELLTSLEIWLDQDKSLYNLKNEIEIHHPRGGKEAFIDGYEEENKKKFDGLLKSLETQYSFSDKPVITQKRSGLESAILEVWHLNKRNLGVPLKDKRTLIYREFVNDIQVYIAQVYVTSFEIKLWDKPEFKEIFEELWDRNVNPMLNVGSFEKLPVGTGPNSSSDYWSTDESIIKENFKSMDRALIQKWISEIVAEYPKSPFGEGWTPKPRANP